MLNIMLKISIAEKIYSNPVTIYYSKIAWHIFIGRDVITVNTNDVLDQILHFTRNFTLVMSIYFVVFHSNAYFYFVSYR